MNEIHKKGKTREMNGNKKRCLIQINRLLQIYP